MRWLAALFSADEAVTLDAIDFLAQDRDELLSTVHSRQIKLASGRTATINTAGVRTVDYHFGWLRGLLQIGPDQPLDLGPRRPARGWGSAASWV